MSNFKPQVGDKVRVKTKVSATAPDVGSEGTVVPKLYRTLGLIEVRFADREDAYGSFPFYPNEIEAIV